MPERYEIRGQDLPDGNKSLSPKDIYNVNKNFETVGLEVFGNADFTRKIDKKVNDLAIQTDAIISTVADKADTSLLGNYSTITQTADAISQAVLGEFDQSVLLNYSTLTQTADAITSAVSGKAEATNVYTKGEIDIQNDNINISIENIQIGGTNHFGRSTIIDYFNATGMMIGSFYPEAPNGFVVLGASSGETNGTVRLKNVIDSNGDWTIKMLVKSNGSVPIKIDFNDIPAEDIIPTQGYQWYERTVNVTNYTADVYNFIDLSGLGYAYYYFDAIKIEKGNKATDWSQHPDDMVGKTEVLSSINLSPEEIKIQSNKISIEGLTTINSNFKVLLDGSIEAVNAKLSGAITATKMESTISPNYYGEIGVSDGNVGLGLYDTVYDSGPFMRIVELPNGNGFALMDTNNIQRIFANAFQTALQDSNNKGAFQATTTNRVVYSPDQKNYIVVTNDVIQIVKNGVVKASW